MAIQILASNLQSRIRRSKIGSDGVRWIKRQDWYQSVQGFDFGKLLQRFAGFYGWLVQALLSPIPGINFVDLVQAGISLFKFVWNFNWDMSDEQIDKLIISMQGQIISQAAGLAGSTLGRLICGGAPVAAMLYINREAALHVMQSAFPEIIRDWCMQVGSFLRVSAASYARQWAYRVYKNGRKLIKAVLLGGGKIGDALLPLCGGRKNVEAWGDAKVEDWSFRAQRQAARNKLPDEFNGQINTIWNQDSSDEFFDNFSDACEESLIAVAQGLDSYMAQRRTEEQRREQNVSVNIRPDGRDGEEILLISPRADVFQNVSDILENRQLIENRDMGAYMGEPWDQVVITKEVGIQMTLVFYNYPAPPYWSKDRAPNLAKTEIRLPNIDRHKIDWTRIKDDFGRSSPFFKGSVKGSVNLSNGRHFAFYADSDFDIEKITEKIERYFEVGVEIVYPIRFADHKGRGKNRHQKYIKPQKMYLAYMYLLNWETVNKYTEARLLGGTEFKDPRKKPCKIPMFFDKKPYWVDDEIRNALQTSLEVKK